MTDDLVKQRRKYAAHLRDVGYEPIADAFVEDADRIEALTAENERLRAVMSGLMEIAEMAMPDTFFQTDSRVNAARTALGGKQ